MKSWTIMIFMAGDNDLEGAAHADLIEMTRAGKSDQVNVVAEFDSRRDGTRRYEAHNGWLQMAGKPLEETNTGDPAVLTRFIRWARIHYPAEKEMLVIWNHGTGWEDIPSDFKWSKIRDATGRQLLRRALFTSTIETVQQATIGERAIAADASSRDFLDNRELQKALVDALDGHPLDVLGMDACLMACVEVAYQIRDQARYLVASQELEPKIGWPYDLILGALYARPVMSARELSGLIVEAYGERGKEARARTKYTQSALDLGQAEDTKMMVQALSESLSAYPECNLLLRRAINEVSQPERGAKRYYDRNLVDFYDWLWQLQRRYRGDDQALDEAVGNILDRLKASNRDSFLVANSAVDGRDTERVHGVSIYLPQYRQYNALYEDLDFASSGWPRFARAVSERVR